MRVIITDPITRRYGAPPSRRCATVTPAPGESTQRSSRAARRRTFDPRVSRVTTRSGAAGSEEFVRARLQEPTLTCPRFSRARFAATGRDQPLQTPVDVEAPSARARLEALELRHKAAVPESQPAAKTSSCVRPTVKVAVKLLLVMVFVSLNCALVIVGARCVETRDLGRRGSCGSRRSGRRKRRAGPMGRASTAHGLANPLHPGQR
jgi:hypothetical protein